MRTSWRAPRQSPQMWQNSFVLLVFTLASSDGGISAACALHRTECFVAGNTSMLIQFCSICNGGRETLILQWRSDYISVLNQKEHNKAKSSIMHCSIWCGCMFVSRCTCEWQSAEHHSETAYVAAHLCCIGLNCMEDTDEVCPEEQYSCHVPINN